MTARKHTHTQIGWYGRVHMFWCVYVVVTENNKGAHTSFLQTVDIEINFVYE